MLKFFQKKSDGDAGSGESELTPFDKAASGAIFRLGAAGIAAHILTWLFPGAGLLASAAMCLVTISTAIEFGGKMHAMERENPQPAKPRSKGVRHLGAAAKAVGTFFGAISLMTIAAGTVSWGSALLAPAILVAGVSTAIRYGAQYDAIEHPQAQPVAVPAPREKTGAKLSSDLARVFSKYAPSTASAPSGDDWEVTIRVRRAPDNAAKRG